MKSSLRNALLSVLVAALSLACAAAASAQTEDEAAPAAAPSASSYQSQTTPFTLIILGTRDAGDVQVIRKNLTRLPSVKSLIPSFESQKHIEFFGALAGSAENLEADVRSLAADRYSMEVRDDKRRGLVITLSKLAPQ